MQGNRNIETKLEAINSERTVSLLVFARESKKALIIETYVTAFAGVLSGFEKKGIRV